MANQDKQYSIKAECRDTDSSQLNLKKELSMSSLILWNIQKAIDINSSINLMDAIKSTSERLEKDSYDVQVLMSQKPEEQHLACAILAWQRLGHTNVESLHKFIKLHQSSSCSKNQDEIASSFEFRNSNNFQELAHCSKSAINTSSIIGPVVRLPVETKIVMHVENPCSRHQPKKPQKNQKDVMNKIEACCMDTACIKRLTELDSATAELRKRAARLARREAERVELLERAETAWKDLEVGYQRRLALAEEKEEDITKQIKKLIEDRNAYKNATNTLVQKLKERGAAVEKERDRLTQIEKEVCNKACERLRLSEQAAQGDAAVAELQCRSTQLDRDLLYKEEQARRKVIALENEADSIRGLTLEAERAMRSELSALKEQITDVSKQLLLEEETNNKIKAELEDLKQEKMNIIEDLEGCKEMCDGRIQKRVDILKTKREQLNELKNRVIECQCKLPLDVSVEVKRTPSLAALCHCAPEDKLLDSCSCVSLRSQLLSNLLSDLFSGLQSELGGNGSQMPCQLLKCLEYRHNWDRSSMVKANLRNFFAQLLIGELDIAIATSIEKYHAKWIGASCADQLKSVCRPCEEQDDNEGWQDRAIERRAQKLATKLAEQLFKERADLITQKAKDIMLSGPPPCECKPQQSAAVYPCLVKTNPPTSVRKSYDGPSSYLKRTIQDVTNIKTQIEDLKKESIKKEDLRHMEDKLTKIIQRVSKQENKKVPINNDKNDYANVDENQIKNVFKKKHVDAVQPRKIPKIQNHQSGRIEKHSSKYNYKKKEPSLAVNLCLCTDQNKEQVVSHSNTINRNSNLWKPTLFPELTTQISNIKLSKPIIPLPFHSINKEKKLRNKPCPSNCICLHKKPSNKSIDRLLETLKTWKYNTGECFTLDKLEKESSNKASKFSLQKKLETLNKSTYNKETLESVSKIAGSNFVETASDKINFVMPLTTSSEYMGAINLDKTKSNETVCKCLNEVRERGKTTLKYIEENLCLSRRDNTHNEIKKTCEGEAKIQSVKYPVEKDYLQSKREAGIQNNSFLDKIVKDSQLFSHGCDYDIKFLGATLTNINKTQEKSKTLIENLPSVSKNINTTVNKENVMTSYKKGFSDLSLSKAAKESCVCCRNKEIASDLECNAFNLLQDYLRQKLNLFKNQTCKSSCIQAKDEEKLYSTILEKVKELIVVNTKAISCKCFQETKTDESWSRVYGLLQEYLHMKIQRVKCSCTKNDSTKNDDIILPNILEEVTNLIENDFQKLKDICICYTKNDEYENFHESQQNKINVHFSEPKFDKVEEPNCLLQFEKATSLSRNLGFVNKSCSAVNIIPLNVKMIEKVTSCELNTQHTLYATDCDCRYIFQEPELLESDNICTNENIQNLHFNTYSENTGTKTSINSDDTHSNYENKQLPYIGYTFNCTCDHNLGCVCTKSVIESNDSKINMIWNSLSHKMYSKKLSYIMHAVQPSVKSEHKLEHHLKLNIPITPRQDQNDEDYFDNHERQTLCADKYDYCQTQTSLKEEEGLVLKMSEGVINKTSNNTNTDKLTRNNNGAGSSSHPSFVTVPNLCEDMNSNKNTLYSSLYLPAVDFQTNSAKSDLLDSNSDITLLKSLSQNCDCNMVPICHVKMLVENIEHNLKNSKCICDSMSSHVCPIHSK